MGDTTITIIAIFLAAILMFVFPMMTLSDRNDEVTQLAIQTETTEFVDGIRTTGKLTLEEYESYLSTINATGNLYSVELEFKLLDENAGKKTTQASSDKIGENEYVSEFTTQIEAQLKSQGVYTLKEGDIVSVQVKNSSNTLSQTLKNFYFKIIGNDTYVIAAEHAGIVAVNGK